MVRCTDFVSSKQASDEAPVGAVPSARGCSLIRLLAIWGLGCTSFHVLHSSPSLGQEQTLERASPNSPSTSHTNNNIYTHTPASRPGSDLICWVQPRLSQSGGFVPGGRCRDVFVCRGSCHMRHRCHREEDADAEAALMCPEVDPKVSPLLTLRRYLEIWSVFIHRASSSPCTCTTQSSACLCASRLHGDNSRSTPASAYL